MPPGTLSHLSLANGLRPAKVRVGLNGLANGLRPAMVRVWLRVKERIRKPSLANGHRPAMVLPHHKVQGIGVPLDGLVKTSEDG